ncbi:MAG: F-type H+-transporting ATPase subunit gamma [Candidatus Deianiraeaceae bacterium]|jgi:F-type H+-transporting ATPase subunit gamma
MANLKEVKNRIGSVKSTQKITKAMKMISTARLNKAKFSLNNHEQYASAMGLFLSSIIPLVNRETHITKKLSYNFVKNEDPKTLIVICSTDKGLCGALNTFLFKEFHNHINSNDIILPLGRKAFDYTKSRFKIATSTPIFTAKPEYYSDIINNVFNVIETHSIGKIKIIFPEFISVMLQTPKVEYLPQKPNYADFTVEGSLSETLEMALIETISSTIQATLSQLLCSEHSARMIAMDNATNNAQTKIESLTLTYNKTRQSNITREILEIVAGSQAV